MILPDADLAGLVRGAPWKRLAVLGDSTAEGVREPLDGYRDLSWIDRIAEALRSQTPGLELLNLGRRNLLAAEVRTTQLHAALGFRPDLAIVSAGGNDSLRPTFESDAVERELDAMVGALRASGADVLMLELMDIVASGLVPPEHAAALDERMSTLAAITRAVAQRHRAILVEMRRHPASAEPGVYASDRLHLNAYGHAIVGTEAVRALSTAILRIDVSEEDILADLTWPGPPPGQWSVRSNGKPYASEKLGRPVANGSDAPTGASDGPRRLPSSTEIATAIAAITRPAPIRKAS
jgi:lysophospholipase L1-like esterase